MSTVSFQDWQNDPDALLRRVAAGESFVVIREGKPVAEIRPAQDSSGQPRPFGLCQGQFTTPESFADPLPDDDLQGFNG